MSDLHSTHVFAQSLFKLGVQDNMLDKFEHEFRVFIDLFSQNEMFHTFLLSPKIMKDKKKAILTKILGKDFSKEFIAFITVILLKRYQSLLKNIYRMFEELVDIHKQRLRGKVLTVTKLDDKIFKEIQDLLHKKYRKEVILKNVVDPSILGGLILIIDNHRIDLSILQNLEIIKNKIIQSKLSGVFS